MDMKKMPLFLLIIFSSLFVTVLQAQDTIIVTNKVCSRTVNKIIPGLHKNTLCTTGGIIEYNPENDSILNWYKPVNSMLKGTRIVDFAFAPDSSLWFCDSKNGVFCFNSDSTIWYNHFTSPITDSADQFFTQVEFDQSGNLWIGSNLGLYERKVDGSWSIFCNDSTHHIVDIYKDEEGTLYVSALKWMITIENGNLQYSNLDTMMQNDILLKVFITSEGVKYYVGYNYSYKFLSEDSIQCIKLSDFDESLDDYQHDILENKNGDIFFIGSNGFVVLKKDSTTAIYSENTLGSDILKGTVGAFYDNLRDEVLISKYNKGLIKFNDTIIDSLCLGCSEMPERSFCFGYIDSEDRMWGGSFNVSVLEDTGWYTINSYGWLYNYISATSEGEIALSTEDKVWFYSNGEMIRTQVCTWCGNWGVYELSHGKNDYIYASTKVGIFKRKPYTNYWTEVGLKEKDYVDFFSIDIDTVGNVWFTNEEGIGYCSYPDETFIYYNVQNSQIPQGQDYSRIRCDSLGRIWLWVDNKIYVDSCDINNWKLVVPKVYSRPGYSEFTFDIGVDSFNNTWLVLPHELRFMNKSDTIVYQQYDGIFANSEGFSQGRMSSDGTFWIFGCGGLTGMKYENTEGVKPPEIKRVSSFVKVYPNPASKFIQFELNGIGKYYGKANRTITIFDQLGRVITKQVFNGNVFLWDTRGVKRAVYFYNIQVGNKVSTGKFVIE